MEDTSNQSKRVGVHIIMSGIVSIIPTADKVVIRFQDARKAGHHGGHGGHGSHGAHGSHPGADIHSHYPSVVAETEFADWPTSHPPTVTATQVGARKLAGWLIDYPDGAMRTIAFVKNGNKQKIVGPPLEAPTDPTHPILRIADACEDRKCATAKKQSTGLELHATHGFLHASALEPVQWRWEGKETAKSIAEEVCLSFWIEDPPLVLELPDAKGNTWRLEIRPPDDGGDIEVRLQNAPEDEIIPGFLAVPQESWRKDHHAALYFDECKYPPSPKVVLETNETPTGWLPPSGHRLEGRRIAARTSSQPSTETIRVNCPPALWEELES